MKTFLFISLLLPGLALSQAAFSTGDTAAMASKEQSVSGGVIVPAFTQQTFTNNASNSRATARCVITNNGANFMVAVAKWAIGASGSITIGDSKGNNWTPIGAQVNWGPANNIISYMWYATNIISGSNAVTATLNTSATFGSIAVYEWSGVALFHPVDVSPTATKGTSSSTSFTMITGNATTTQAGDLLISYADTGNGNITLNGGSGYTIRGANAPVWLADQVQGAASATTTASAHDDTNSDQYLIWLAAFFHQ